MAKLSEKLRENNTSKIFGLNSKEVLFAIQAIVPQAEMPEDIQVLLQSAGFPRINSAKCVSLERFCALEGATYYGNAGQHSGDKKPGIAIVPVKGKAFPQAYIYLPDFEEATLQCENRIAREKNLTMVETALRSGFNLQLSKCLKDIISTDLPPKKPNKVFFDGSEVRFKRLCLQAGATCYPVNSPLVVVRTSRNSEVSWTFFVKEIDYRSRFSRKLEYQLNISRKLADEIANNWAHDTYVSINPQAYTDAMTYAQDMAYHGRLREGQTIHDLLQGELTVVKAIDNQATTYIDIDDEKPSALIVNNRLNVYLPNN